MQKLLLTAAIAGMFLNPGSANAETKTAIFAGGCFWCVESDFEKVNGVEQVISGYAGGTSDNPTYKNHSAAGHLEVAQIIYDPAVVSYSDLLETYWRTIDPTDDGGQFCDRGHSYTTAVFALDDEQASLAEASKKAAQEALGKTIVTPIRGSAAFYEAEGYHQDYYKRNTVRYKYYRWACGRDARVEELWGDEAYKGVTGHKGS